jgi:hypothetical protein
MRYPVEESNRKAGLLLLTSIWINLKVIAYVVVADSICFPQFLSLDNALFLSHIIQGKGGDAMLEVTALAQKNLKEYLTQNNIDSPVRVAIMQGG